MAWVRNASPGPAASGETLAPSALAGPQPAGLTPGFAKAGGSHHDQAATDQCRDSHRGVPKPAFKGSWQAALLRAQCAPLRARNPSNRQHLSSPWQSKKLPTFLRDSPYFIFLLPVRRTGTRDHIAGEKEVMKGRAWKGVGYLPLGVRVQGG